MPPSAETLSETLALRDPELRKDLVDGLRFVHLMGDVTRREVYQTAITVLALIEELREKGELDALRHEDRLGELQSREVDRMQEHLHVRLEQRVDKYGLKNLPDIDCDARIPLCRARCCTLHFPLSSQDLDERIVKWDYSKPYIIRQRESDGYCVHNHPVTHGCTVYRQRPAVCRTYDCSKDKRIWVDFGRRIPVIDPDLEPKLVPVPHGEPPARPGPMDEEAPPDEPQMGEP